MICLSCDNSHLSVKYQVRSEVVLVSLQFLLITSSYSVWPELCISRMKRGVEDCRYRYHMFC